MLLISVYLKNVFTVHLNDIATKGPPEALLLRIVELIVGEIPGVFHFRLGHILIETSHHQIRTIVTFTEYLKIGLVITVKF